MISGGRGRARSGRLARGRVPGALAARRVVPVLAALAVDVARPPVGRDGLRRRRRRRAAVGAGHEAAARVVGRVGVGRAAAVGVGVGRHAVGAGRRVEHAAARRAAVGLRRELLVLEARGAAVLGEAAGEVDAAGLGHEVRRDAVAGARRRARAVVGDAAGEGLEALAPHDVVREAPRLLDGGVAALDLRTGARAIPRHRRARARGGRRDDEQ
mmetsp:Transcript_13835/g.47533  ORF Transcript_13835/g.47533 Transcript_13835/m.47533 type:complete len:213 (+) Transcript_13835:52-690(+)